MHWPRTYYDKTACSQKVKMIALVIGALKTSFKYYVKSANIILSRRFMQCLKCVSVLQAPQC